jgi:hypothetical protein
MKGCFILQRQFAHIGHAIARNLLEHYGVQEFCGYVYTRSSYEYLSEQSDVRYTTLLLDEEIHKGYRDEPLDIDYLAWLEREYGTPFCWPYLAIDRVLMSGQLVREYPYDKPPYTHDEMMRMLQVRAKAILKMLDEEKPDFLFCSVLGGVGSLFLYHVAKKRGIKTFIVHPSLLRNRYLLSDQFERFTWVDELTWNDREVLRKQPAWKEAGRYLESFRTQPIPYSDRIIPAAQSVTRRKQLKFINPLNAWHSLREFGKSVISHYTKPYRDDYSYIGPWNYLRDMTKRKMRNLIGLGDLYDDFMPNDTFAFFPLQYEPEISISLHAPYNSNQIHLIRQAARSLPVHYKIYVKEHPQMVEYRPRRFYKELKKIPNLKLINPTISSFAITPRAKIIFTIAGTVGWESVLLKKPVINFGHWFYNSLPMVKYCSEMESLPYLVKEQLENCSYDDEIMQAFLAAIINESVEIDLVNFWIYESDPKRRKEGLRTLTDLLAKKLKLRNIRT